MNGYVYILGFAAQLLFAGRMLVQWVLSEKQQSVVTPSVFWKLSILGAFLMFVYGYLRQDFAIMFGQTLTWFIYIRNLQLQGQWKRLPALLQFFLWIFPALVVAYAHNDGRYNIDLLFRNESVPLWLLLLGSVAHLVFTMRFAWQWVYSERKKESALPMGFWVLSLSGAALILVYGILRKDPVLIVANLGGGIVYARNLYLLKQQSQSVSRADGTNRQPATRNRQT